MCQGASDAPTGKVRRLTWVKMGPTWPFKSFFTLGYYPLVPVISVQPKILKFRSARGGQNGRNVNDAEGRAAALHTQSARHDRGPCRI